MQKRNIAHAYARTKVGNDMEVKGAKIGIYHEEINWLRRFK
jgi:hypothetical protein